MNFKQGLALRGAPAIIPDCSRDDLPAFLVEMGCHIGAEIGAHKGEFTAKFCEAGLTMYAIDPWMPFEGQGRTQKLQEVQDGYMEEAIKNLSGYHRCKMVRKTSMDALDDIQDGSLDFVYIDGDHNFRHATEDIFEWSKKVRVGGYVSGHDYFDTLPTARNIVCNVKAVVDAYTKAFNIKNWYIFKPDVANDANNKFYSWLWKRE